MQVIAHRGNNKESLENSFDAYEKAVECGAVRIELDVQLTRDGHAVINHDNHLLHTTGKDLYCSHLDRSDFAKTAKALKGSTQRDKVIISSFCRKPLIYMLDHEPDLQRACLTGDDELPWPFFSHLSPLNFMQDVKATILHPRFNMVTENMMDQARARKWKVYTWSTMAGEDASRTNIWTILSSFGVDGHCTNYPREMLKWKKESELYDQRVKNLFSPT
ncbi:MAG: glycerophosphodiester phosphodiesterase [Proteobacteria bacterium]|nr:glycerophosphodiester phosphodiesterase [Pseudomonadota bacterium]